MNKIIVIAFLILFAGIGAYFYLPKMTQNNVDTVVNDMNDGTKVSDDDQIVDGNVPSNRSIDRIIPYSEANLQNADGRVLLFFSAVWCPTCKAAKSDIRQNGDQMPNDISILEVDFDTDLDLRNKYGVVRQHTFVQVDMDGNEITQWSGGGVLEIIDNIEEV